MPDRQPYPVGDLERGQIVQPGNYFPTRDQIPQWDIDESITVSSTVIGLTAGLAATYQAAFITVEGASVRYRIGNPAIPTATVGHPLDVGDTLRLETQDELQSIRFIRRDSVDATLYVTYGNYPQVVA